MELLRSEKRIILVLLGVVVIILVSVLLLGVRSKPGKQQTIPFPSPIGPTYFPGGQVFNKSVTIISTDPDNNATGVSIAPTITIVFSRSLTPLEQKAVTFTSTPSANFQSFWSTDNTTATYSPTQALQPNQTYTLALSYGSITHVWSFTTKPETSFTNQDLQSLQTISDTTYAKQQAATKANYPWIDSLPISSSTYFTYFDFDTNSFITHMYYEKGSPLSQAQQDTIKNQVIQALRNISVDTTKYKLVWQPTLVSE